METKVVLLVEDKPRDEALGMYWLMLNQFAPIE
jgi:hypothetical protein